MNQEKWDKYIYKDDIEKTNHGLHADSRSFDYNFIVSNFVDFKNKKILDIGCEEGIMLSGFKRTSGCDCTGITLNLEGTEKEKDIKFIKADMHELPFEDSTFDVILCAHTLEHSIAPYIVLSEVRRVLKMGGKFICIMPEEGDMWTSVNSHYSVMTFRQLFNLLNKLRFNSIANYRKEYTVNMQEFNRDIIAIWEKTEEIECSLIDSIPIIIPVKGNPLTENGGHIIITPILTTKLMAENNNHFIGKTDSLNSV